MTRLFRICSAKIPRGRTGRSLFVATGNLLPVIFLLAGFFGTACGPVTDVGCPCIICDQSAVTLTVVAASGEPVQQFWVEHIVNGEGRGEPESCREGAREINVCAFGRDVGIYDVIVRAPGYEQAEGRVRVAPTGSPERCCSSCLSGNRLRMVLRPEAD